MVNFQLIQEQGISHYADVSLAQRWASRASMSASRNRESALSASWPDDQRAALIDAMGSLANAFRALNLSPPTVRFYRTVMQRAYGAGVDLEAGIVSGGHATDFGWMAGHARDVAERAFSDASLYFTAHVRMWLTTGAGVVSTCIRSDTPTQVCSMFDPSSPDVQFYAPSGVVLSTPPFDWQAVGVAGIPPNGIHLLPGAIGCMAVIRQLSESIAVGMTPSAVIAMLVDGARPLVAFSYGAPSNLVEDVPATSLADASTATSSFAPTAIAPAVSMAPAAPATRPAPAPVGSPTTPPAPALAPVTAPAPSLAPAPATPLSPAPTTPTISTSSAEPSHHATPAPLGSTQTAAFAPILIGALAVGAILMLQRPAKRRK